MGISLQCRRKNLCKSNVGQSSYSDLRDKLMMSKEISDQGGDVRINSTLKQLGEKGRKKRSVCTFHRLGKGIHERVNK